MLAKSNQILVLLPILHKHCLTMKLASLRLLENFKNFPKNHTKIELSRFEKNTE